MTTIDSARKALVLAALERIDSVLADGSERQRSLLRYLVQEELEGRGERIKAYSIATDVFGRPADFDPQLDSIVRVEVGRLRKALELYYATDGKDAPVRISIDKGQYRPAFIVAAAQTEPPPATGAETAPDAPVAAPRGRRASLIALAAAAFAICAATAFYLLRPTSPPVQRAGPRIAVAPFAMSADREGQAYVGVGLQAELAAVLSEFDWLTVFPLARDIDIVGGERSANWRVDFVVKSTVQIAGEALVVSTLLLDGKSGAVRWSGRYHAAFKEHDVMAMQRDIATRIAADVGQPYGVVADLERTRLETDRFHGDDAFRCQLRALQFWTSYRRSDFVDARDCATRIGAAPTADPNVRAALALLKLDSARFGFDDRPRDQEIAEAADLAADAYRRSESGALPRIARYSLALCTGDVQTFRRVGLAARKDYPNNPATLSDVGMKLALGAGEWQAGLDLVARARVLAANVPLWFDIVSAVDALRRDQPFAAAGELHDAALQTGHPLLLLVDLAVQGKKHDKGAAERDRAELANLGYATADAVLDLLDRQCWAAPAKDALKPGLRLAMQTAGAK